MDDLKHFLAVARHGSTLAAGRALGVDQSTAPDAARAAARAGWRVLVAPDKRHVPRVAAFFDFVVDEIARFVRSSRGERPRHSGWVSSSSENRTGKMSRVDTEPSASLSTTMSFWSSGRPAGITIRPPGFSW